MKYKTGDRFIIEIEEKLSTPRTALYKIKDFNSLVLAENELDRLVQEHDGSETGKTYPELLKVLEELPKNDE